MDTKERLMLAQMIVTPIVSLSIPFIAAKLAKANPKVKTDTKVAAVDKIWQRPPFFVFVLLIGYEGYVFLYNASKTGPLDASTVGALCMSSASVAMGLGLFLGLSHYYSLRRSLEADREHLDRLAEAILDTVQQTSYLKVKSEILKAQSDAAKKEDAEQVVHGNASNANV